MPAIVYSTGSSAVRILTSTGVFSRILVAVILYYCTKEFLHSFHRTGGKDLDGYEDSLQYSELLAEMNAPLLVG